MAIKNGDTVRVHYTGTLPDGTVFDSSRGREPLEFVMGRKTLIPGFEAALLGREVGDRLTVHIPPDQGYGEADPELIFSVERTSVPAGIHPEPGMRLQLSVAEGVMEVSVLEVNEDFVKLDANHALAGKTLTFDLEVVAAQ